MHLEADDPRATLSIRRGTGIVDDGPFMRPRFGTIWEDVCVAPCDRAVDGRGVYRVDGEGLMPSGSFRLPAGNVDLRARTGSKGGWVGGLLLTSLGAGFTLAGAMTAGFSTIPVDSTSGNVESQRSARAFLLDFGLVALGIGVVSVVTGVALLVGNTTHVTDGRAAHPRRGPTAEALDAHARRPRLLTVFV